MSVHDLLEWEDRVDHRFDTSLPEQRYNFARESIRDFDLLVQRARAQHRADHMKTFAQDLIELDLRLTACDAPNQNDPAPHRHRFEARGEVWTTIQIEYDVKTF